MLEVNGRRIYPISNTNSTIQGTVTFSNSLIESNTRAEIRFIGQIDKNNEEEMAKEIEKVIKKFYL